MKKQKSNPYVYPYVPFKKLNDKELIRSEKEFIKDKFKISISDLKNIINKTDTPLIEHKKGNINEMIFNIFLNEKVLFGPRSFIESKKNFWLEKIDYFIKKNEKIRFTLLGFPFKIPVPLKTNRVHPDMGEVLILLQLSRIIKSIEKIYEPGAEIVTFTEGGLGKFVGVSKKEANGYKNFLIFLNKELGFSDSIIIKELSEMEKEKDFNKLFDNNFKELKEKFEKKDKEVIKKYIGAGSSIFKVLNTREIKEKVLMDVYNESIPNDSICKDAKEVREKITQKLPDAIMGYFAYLKTRDDLNYLEKIIPHGLALSVSPKPGRLGIIPISEKVNKLPYHAVTIFNKNRGFYLNYLIDLKCGKGEYTAVYLDKDNELKTPFYYIEHE